MTVYIHTLAIHTLGTLWYLNFEVLEHPSCSHDRSFWSITCLVHSKMIFRGCLCPCNQQVKERVHACLVSQPKTLRVYRLVAQWTECVENKHDYVEK